jgi:predicted RNA-binding Zn ribbon-like protein
VTAQASIPGERDHPSLALVNSRHHSRTGMVDHLASPEALGEWLTWRSLVAHGDDSRLDRAAERSEAARLGRDAPRGELAAPRRAAAPDDTDLEATLALRDAARELLVAAVQGRAPAPPALAAINDAAAIAPAAHQVRWDVDGGPVRTRSAPAATDVQRALAAIAEDAIALVCDHRDDLIACEAPGCVRLLLKDHPRRHWCSTRCGDRVRAARHYRRSRESAG